MKFTAWRTWLWNKLGRFLRPKRPRTLATAGCVALGLATAWGGEAEADITFKVEVTPAHDLLDAFVYFGNNATAPTLRSLGPLEGGKPHESTHTLTPAELEHSPARFETLFSDGGKLPLGFAVAGLYQRDEDFGITVSMPDRLLLDEGGSWEDFASAPPLLGFDDSEEQVADQYLGVSMEQPDYWSMVIPYIYHGYTESYNNSRSVPEEYRDERYLTLYGKEATLISFRDTRFAGTAIVTIVPEPQSVFYVVAFACMALATGGNRLSQGRAK